MAVNTVIRHHSSVDLNHSCNVEVSLVSKTQATEVYLRLSPVSSGTSRNACHIQTRVLYDALDEVLHGLRARVDHLLLEKVFFRNLPRDHEDFAATRRLFYRKRGLVGAAMPGITCLGQPPCRPGVDVEMQVYAIVPRSPDAVIVTNGPSGHDNLSVKLVQVGAARHLFINGATGHALNGEPNGVREQSDRMFAVARDALAEHGATFGHVLRTWVYLPQIAADYPDWNASRTQFLAGQKLDRLPAGTGIGALSHLPSTRCTLDAYALLSPELATIEVMGQTQAEETPEGSPMFSRGIRMTLPESTYLFISGTPGVDPSGTAAADVGTQVDRMLGNVEELLRDHGAGWDDLAHAVTCLKFPEHLPLYEAACAARGIDNVPHSIVRADACRPEVVCEMEAVAVIPSV
ncbi:MAG: RidA family protein [Thermoguttaceae bacterium]